MTTEDIFENFWLRKAAEAWGKTPDVAPAELLEKVRPAVEELSDLFTTERPKDGRFRDYMSEAKLLAAYGLFFFPQSFARARFAVSRLLGVYSWLPEKGDGPLRILDLGSGASPCGLAAATELRKIFPEREIIITALDRSRNAIDAARELAADVASKTDARLSVVPLAADLKKFIPAKSGLPPQDLILLGWSLNEAVPADEPADAFLRGLSGITHENGAIITLEPALKITAERLQRMSDTFAVHPGEPFFRLAPELGNHACPLLSEGIFWNHEVRKWTPPESLEFLNRTLFREIGALKFSWCALGKKPGKQFTPPAKAAEILRLVSPFETTKTCMRFVGVNPQGRKISIEIPTRGFSKSEVKKLAGQWERGDIAILKGTLAPVGSENHFRLSGSLEKFNG